MNPQLRNELYERVGKMVARGISQRQIAIALQLSESRVSQLCAMPAVQDVAARVSQDQLDRWDTLNEGWDRVEEFSLGQVLEAVANNPDPEFALKVMTVANKAVRRGSDNNARTVQGQTVERVVQLSTTFIQRLEVMEQAQIAQARPADGEAGASQLGNEPHKRRDVLDTAETEALLGIQPKESLQDRVVSELAALFHEPQLQPDMGD